MVSVLSLSVGFYTSIYTFTVYLLKIGFKKKMFRLSYFLQQIPWGTNNGDSGMVLFSDLQFFRFTLPQKWSQNCQICSNYFDNRQKNDMRKMILSFIIFVFVAILDFINFVLFKFSSRCFNQCLNLTLSPRRKPNLRNKIINNLVIRCTRSFYNK